MDGELDLFFSAGPTAVDGAWSVAQVTRRARQLVETGLSRLWVQGEVSGFKSYRSGHWYFSLRDSEAQVRCVMWRSDNQQTSAEIEDGLQIFAEAQPTVWEERGEFRLTVRRIIPTTTGGEWELKLKRAKAALEKDGLLDPSRKRPLPEFPSSIAIVTSPDGAALHDILTVLRRRWPAVEVVLVPTLVQGESAEGELCRALRRVDGAGVELAIVGRGGGSREDLWAFNSERVARAVAAVKVPTISAVGHEEDVTLTDLVADLRAPTPSAAAEAAVPDRKDVSRLVDILARRMGNSLKGLTRVGRERLDRSGDRLFSALQGQIDDRANRLATLAAKLDALSPLKVLQRGFSVARDDEDRVLKSIHDFTDRPFRITVSDGDVRAQVVDLK